MKHEAEVPLTTSLGKIGATGMCLGGHLAFRAAFDKRVSAAVCYFATGESKSKIIMTRIYVITMAKLNRYSQLHPRKRQTRRLPRPCP